MHTHTHLDTPRRERMKWGKMKWIVTCGYHVCNMTLLPILENTWHDKRQAGSWVSRIPYREQVQVHASMNPSTTSSIASLGNIGRWAVAPLLVPFDSGLSTHTQQAAGARFCEPENCPQSSVLFSTVLCCDMEHGAQMSVTLCCLPQHKTKGSFTAFSASSTEKADNSKPLHQNFRLFSKQPTTDKKGW